MMAPFCVDALDRAFDPNESYCIRQRSARAFKKFGEMDDNELDVFFRRCSWCCVVSGVCGCLSFGFFLFCFFFGAASFFSLQYVLSLNVDGWAKFFGLLFGSTT
mmetsp:Transcript_51941/g.86143  ORF Transcript_51941/g.86143 Transcript_51941/m.86143 type:complete len:104 (+) Transcript_51941:299-610(+)